MINFYQRFIGYLQVAALLAIMNGAMTWAEGFRSPYHDSAAMGQGNAFRAQADNPSAIHFNPAGMTQLAGVQLSAGVQFVSPNTTFTSQNGNTIENEISRPVIWPFPAQFFLTTHLKSFEIPWLESMWIGLGLDPPYGIGNKYPKNGPFATTLTRVQLPLLDIKPTIAYKITDWFSLGVGADIYTFADFLGEGQFEQQFIALGNIPGTFFGEEIEINGTGTTAGLNVSGLVTPLRHVSGKPLVNIGFIWRSQAVLLLKGTLLANGRKVANISRSITLPESYEWGLAVWPIRNQDYDWKLEVDVDLVRWSSIRNFDVSLSNGIVIPSPQNWSDALTISLGTEWKWLKLPSYPGWEFALRAGYNWSETPIPAPNFNPAFPDSDSHSLSTGVGFSCTKQGKILGLFECESPTEQYMGTKGLAINLAFQAILREPRTVTGNPNPTLNGTYKTRTYAGSLTLQVSF